MESSRLQATPQFKIMTIPPNALSTLAPNALSILAPMCRSFVLHLCLSAAILAGGAKVPPPMVAIPAGTAGNQPAGLPRIQQGSYLNGLILLQGDGLEDARVEAVDGEGRTFAVDPVAGRKDVRSLAASVRTGDGDPGIFWVRAVNAAGASATVRLNAPEPRWLTTLEPWPGGVVRVFGLNLANALSAAASAGLRPAGASEGSPLIPAEVVESKEHEIALRIPEGIDTSKAYDVWVHNGSGEIGRAHV